MRLAAGLVLSVLLIYGAAIGFLALAQRRLIYRGAFDPPPPRPAPPGSEAIIVTTRDGERLHAYWRPPRPGCGVVVSFHGNGSRPEPHAARFAAGPWRDGGWGLLAPAYRGYPGSTGSPTEEGLVLDGLAAVAVVNERAPGAPILLHGHSLGAAVAVAVSERTDPIGLYLEAPFDSLEHLVRLRFPFVPGFLLQDTYRSDIRIRSGDAPVMIVHGEADGVVPPKLGLRLAEAAGSRAEIAIIPGDHVSILGRSDGEIEARFALAEARTCATPPPVVR